MIEVTVWESVLVVIWPATLSRFAWSEIITAVVLALPCAVAARAGRAVVGGSRRPPSKFPAWLGAAVWVAGHDAVAVSALAAHGRPVGRLETLDLPAESPERFSSSRR